MIDKRQWQCTEGGTHKITGPEYRCMNCGITQQKIAWQSEQRGFWAELLALNHEGLRIAQEMQKQVQESLHPLLCGSRAPVGTSLCILPMGHTGIHQSNGDQAINEGWANKDETTAAADDSVKISRQVLAALIDCLDNARHRTDWSDVVRVRRSLLYYYADSLPGSHP